MFCHFSPPEQLHSDQGHQFESELVKEIYVLLQIRKMHTTLYHPQCNGMVERFNRTLLDMLATTIGNHQADWQHHIRKLCLTYNSSIHSTTGFSPFFLMFGRQVTLPIDLMYGTNRTEPGTAAGFAQKLKEGCPHLSPVMSTSITSYPTICSACIMYQWGTRRSPMGGTRRSLMGGLEGVQWGD